VTETTTLTLPILPLTSGVVFPGMVLTIALETAEARAAVEAAGDDGRLLLVPRVDGRSATVGAVVTVESRGALPSGTPALVVRATDRARLGTVTARTDPPAGDDTGAVTWVEADPVHPEITPRARELAAELRAAFQALVEQLGAPRLVEVLRGLDEPDALADAAGWWPELTMARKIELLETLDVAERVAKLLGWVKEALAQLTLQEKIRHEVGEGLEQNQREFLLRQQLAAIRKELGESDGVEEDGADAYRARLAELTAPEAVRLAVAREIGRLERSSDQSPEQGWIRTWLDTVLAVPWATRSTDRLDLAGARAVLDADHHGLDEVKDRIVEELAVRKLRRERGLDRTAATTTTDTDTATATDTATDTATTEPAPPRSPLDEPLVRIVPVEDLLPEPPGPAAPAGPERRHGTIITLVGPPGVGKTSLGESIARALGRSFVRVALGGVRDEAEIRGHRRTYVGAQPGRIVKALTEAGTRNPVVLLDEVDKLGGDWRGDPSAALLEVLDPAQNHAFRDHYLEVDLDLSEVIFVATANQLDTIPAPLLDRMEVVTLDGYTEDEKVAIARDHLVARQRDRAGIEAHELTVTDDALRRMVRDHSREAGVRSLERLLAKVVRKVATGLASQGPTTESDAIPVVVDADRVPELLGRARFHATDIADRTAAPGVATGLAVTGAGGDVLFVETTALPAEGADDPDRSGLTVTGQLGDVMQESARIALSYVRAHREQLGIPEGADRRHVHVHFPAGAVPKDGPSAGITMATALVSLFTGRPGKPTVGMTGEVTLQGRVLPIGGVKQKLLAAHRAGLTEIILPARNEADLDDVPEAVRSQLTIHLADDVADVVRWALQAV
jgi:ATP-dependent Lon protease